MGAHENRSNKPKKKKLALRIAGGTIVLVAVIALFVIIFGIRGDKLLARGDECAASGDVVRAAMYYERYILEDKSNPVGYLRLLDLYEGGTYRNQRADVYRRLVKHSGVDDDGDYRRPAPFTPGHKTVHIVVGGIEHIQ